MQPYSTLNAHRLSQNIKLLIMIWHLVYLMPCRLLTAAFLVSGRPAPVNSVATHLRVSVCVSCHDVPFMNHGLSIYLAKTWRQLSASPFLQPSLRLTPLTPRTPSPSGASLAAPGGSDCIKFKGCQMSLDSCIRRALLKPSAEIWQGQPAGTCWALHACTGY
jgi:hypothetical protein